MSIKPQLRADVVDLRNDTPRAADHFYVDTNVWFWTTYSYASLGPEPPRRYQLSEYPQYIKQCLVSESLLLSSGATFAELSNTIERTAYDIFAGLMEGNITRKKFRHNDQAQRNQVLTEIEDAWKQVTSMARDLPISISALTANGALQRMWREQLDGYDAIVANGLLSSGFNQIITDDVDFATVEGITVFTANLTIIRAARDQGKLIRR